MNHAVYRETPTRAAVSRSGSASAMQAANSIHAAAGSFERASRPSVPAPKVRPQPRHSHLWRPAASRPFLTKAGQPHRGQRSGSPAPAASSSAMASLSVSASSLFSASDIPLTWSIILPTGPPLRCFLDNRIVAGGPFLRVPVAGLCPWWFNSGP